MNKLATIEALKELGRVLLFAAIGWAVAYVTALPETSTTAIILLVLRTLDKYIHENPAIKAKGIAPF